MHVQRRLTIPHPPERVFDLLADFSRTEEWDPGTISTTHLSGDGGLGTRWANTSEFLGRRVELVYETVVHERPREVVFRGEGPRATTHDRMRLRPLPDGGTELVYRADFAFRGLARLAAPLLVGRRLPQLADETIAQLDRVLRERLRG